MTDNARLNRGIAGHGFRMPGWGAAGDNPDRESQGEMEQLAEAYLVLVWQNGRRRRSDRIRMYFNSRISG